MPTTLKLVDGFEHQVPVVGQNFGGASGTSVFSGSLPPGGSYVAGRLGGSALRLNSVASITSWLKLIAAPLPTTPVVSLYIKLETLPAADCQIFDIGETAVGTHAPRFYYRAAGRCFNISAIPGLQASGIDVGPTLTADRWYRIDMRADYRTNFLFKYDISVDGGPNLHFEKAHANAADSCDGIVFGNDDGASGAKTFAAQYDDFILSAAFDDYPIGPHRVIALNPTSDGTHNPGTNTIEDNAGADIGAVTAFNLMDEWPPNTSDYVQQAANGSNYAEVLFEDMALSDIPWGVTAYMSGFASTATALTGATSRIVSDLGVNLGDIFAGDMSDTALNYVHKTYAGPWTPTLVNALRARVGFATDVSASVPRWTALQLHVALSDIQTPSVGGDREGYMTLDARGIS